MDIRTEIDLDASAEEIWHVLTDFPAYGEWNPFITRIDGKARAGGKLALEATAAGGRELRLKPKVLVVDPTRELRWKEHWMMPGLFDGEHYFLLRELLPTKTRLVHGATFSGLLVKAMAPTVGSTTQSFVSMNLALRRRILALRREA